jgi:pimeloyl-ACP methyl ester carboxylesterase
MPFVTVGRENSAAIRICYEDHGTGPPVVLVHGYAQNGHGPARVKAAVLIAPLPPFLLKTHDNPEGIDRSVFDDITARITADRPAAMKDVIDEPADRGHDGVWRAGLRQGR